MNIMEYGQTEEKHVSFLLIFLMLLCNHGRYKEMNMTPIEVVKSDVVYSFQRIGATHAVIL